MLSRSPEDHGPRDAVAGRSSLAGWWYARGEPLALTALVLGAFSLPPLVLLDLLAPRQALRALLLLGWAAGALLLTRLPRLLRQERRRIAALSGIGAAALAALALAGPTPALTEAHAPARALLAPPELPVAATTLTFRSAPRISKSVFTQILQRGSGGRLSPAAPHAPELYDIIAGYGLDPAVALAFFAHESQFCTTGICASADTRNWGGQRAAVKAERVESVVRGPFVRFKSWQDGMHDWCELILSRYINRGLDTVDKAVPVYAPTSDGNVPTAYIDAIYRHVAVWQGRYPDLPSKYVAHVYSNTSLDRALLIETFLSTDAEYHAEWAFHAYMVAETQAGRPLGAPLDESREITVNGTKYAVQTFALDTLYTPIAARASETNWSDVRRLSELIKQLPPQVVPSPTPGRGR